jgi:hypothetical protein
VDETAVAVKPPGGFGGFAALASDDIEAKIMVNEIVDNTRYFLIRNR